jgi:hypothetical protein
MPKWQLKEFLLDESNSTIELMVVACMYKCMLTGDYGRLAAILDRRCGRVKTQIEISGVNGGPVKNEVTTLSDTELIDKARDIERKLNKIE